MKGVKSQDLLEAFEHAKELNDLCQKVIEYLDKNPPTNPNIAGKFLEAYSFLAFTEFGMHLKVSVIGQEATIYLYWVFSKTSTNYSLFTDMVLRNLPIQKKVNKSIMYQFNKHLKYFAYGLGLFITKSRSTKNIKIFFERAKANELIVKRVLVGSKEGRATAFLIFNLIKKYKYFVPDLDKKLVDEKCIALIPDLYNNSNLLESPYDFTLLKPYEDVKNRIVEIVKGSRKCPICGKQINTILIRQDSKVCTRCRKRKSRLKKEALQILKDNENIFDYSMLLQKLKANREKKIAWLKAKNRKSEIWTVQDWGALCKIIWEEIKNKQYS